MYIEGVEGHAYHLSHGFSLCGVYHPLVVNAVNYHLVVNALEHYGFHYARQLGFFRRDHLNVLGTDNDINGLVGVKALVHALKAASRELYHAVLGHTAVDDVALADEVGNEGVDRFVVNVRRGAYLLDIAVVHDNYAVAHGESFLLIVGNVDEGQLQLLLYAAELYLHLLSQLQVKSAQRLIIELKDKVVKGEGSDSSELFGSAARSEVVEEASRALVMLGFAKPAVNKAVQAILKANPNAKVEQIIKSALQMM